MSILIGLATGLTTWGFRILIELTRNFVMEPIRVAQLGYMGVLAVPLILGATGILVGWITSRFVGTERLQGITGIIESVAVGGGRLNYRRMPVKALASVFSIGGGASVGIEDPSVQIASNMGAFFGQRLQLTEEQRRLLIASGAAGATSAAFNAPIAGVFFALEVIMHNQFSTRAVGVIVLASVISAASSQAIGLTETTVGVLDFTFTSPIEIIYFLPLGLIIPPFAVLFTRTLFWQIDFWKERAKHIPYPIRTGVAGLLVGTVGMAFPALLGSGQVFMNTILVDDMQFALWLLLVLAFGKIILTAVSIGGGFVGGAFTPSLFIGVVVGSFYGQLIEGILPVSSDSRVFAVAGMAGMMIGVIRAPIMVIMLVFELTNDYQMILPIMFVGVLSLQIAQAIEPDGVYERGLQRVGLKLSSEHNVDVMQGITVSEVMRPVEVIDPTADLKTLRDLLHDRHRRAMLTTDASGCVTGIVTLSDLQDAYDREDHGANLCVGDIVINEVFTTHPTDSLWVAVRRMGQTGVGRLPVIDRGNGKVVGIINRHDVVRAYNSAIANRIRDLHYAEQIRLHHLTGAHIFELNVTKHAPIANHEIRDVKFPSESTIASIQRDGKLLIPHGDTVILPRDVVTVVAAPEAENDIARLFGM
ncbi:MAG: chloride channel protein [Chloroflexota bacterium]